MSKKVIDRLKAQFGTRILATSDFRGDDEALVAKKDWLEVARFLRDDADLAMNHFLGLTAVDYPSREPELPRFDVVLFVRSMSKNHRVRLKTYVGEGEDVDSVIGVWEGANWTEREVFDMFGVRFKGHPDLRRVLLYPEFVGHPLRKDYPIDRAQPLVEYRKVPGIEKIAPFGPDMGQPFSRVDWNERLAGRDNQVSPAIGTQEGQRPNVSQGAEYSGRPVVPDAE